MRIDTNKKKLFVYDQLVDLAEDYTTVENGTLFN
jgi:hypothetical protein